MSLAIVVLGAALNLTNLAEAISVVESPHGNSDHGRAVGIYQMHRKAFEDAKSKDPGLRAHRHQDLAIKPDVAKRAAVAYLRILSHHLASGGCEVTPTTLWAAWNLGPTRFRARGYSISRCPKSTRERAAVIERLTR